MIIRGIIKIDYYCNSFCVFCHSDFNKVYRSSFEKIIEKIDNGIQTKNINQMLLSGGEPTIHNKFKDIITYIAQNKQIDTGIISNARKLADINFTNFLLSNRCNYYYISLHASNPEIHDKITNSPHSWQEAIYGIYNLISLSKIMSINIDITINCVLINTNLHETINMIFLMKEMNLTKIKFSYPQYKGKMTEDTSIDEMPYIEEVITSILKAQKIAQQYKIECSYDGIPYCFLPTNENHFSIENLQTHNIFYMTEIYENEWFKTDEGKRIKYNECKVCSYNNTCEGIYENAKFQKIVPIKNKVSAYIPFYIENIYNKNISTYTLNVLNNNILQTYHSNWDQNINIDNTPIYYNKTENKSFDLLNLYHIIKQENIYTQTNLKVFDVTNSIWKTFLNKIHGTTLDIGCGEIILSNLLFTNKNITEYYGLEPNTNIYNSTKLKFPNFNFYNNSIENFEYKENYFDSILMIGSYNHIKDINIILTKIKNLLKKDGLLFIIENNPYILLTNTILTPTYEHYRNHSINEAITTLQNNNFIIQEKHHNNSFWFIQATLT